MHGTRVLVALVLGFIGKASEAVSWKKLVCVISILAVVASQGRADILTMATWELALA